MVTLKKLAAIRVLYRREDTLELYGIPCEMRAGCGQTPTNLWDARKTEGWLWLGSPGWWGHLQETEIQAVRAFLRPFETTDLLPVHPNEWIYVSELWS